MKNDVFFLTCHIGIIKNVELLVGICVYRTDFTAKDMSDVYTQNQLRRHLIKLKLLIIAVTQFE